VTAIPELCARRVVTIPPQPAGPVTVQRQLSQRSQTGAVTQRIQVGMIHARKIVTGRGAQSSLASSEIRRRPIGLTQVTEEREKASNPAVHSVTGRGRVGYYPDNDQDRYNDANEPR
jgi:hypothetical protein